MSSEYRGALFFPLLSELTVAICSKAGCGIERFKRSVIECVGLIYQLSLANPAPTQNRITLNTRTQGADLLAKRPLKIGRSATVSELQ